MTVIVPIWQNKLTKKFYCRCWNCGWDSQQSIRLSDTMLAARKHVKECQESGRWTTAQDRRTVMVGVEITFG